MTRLPVTLACALTACAVAATPADAQHVRVSGSSSLRYIELRTLERDSIAADQVAGSGLLRRLPDGRTVRCLPTEPVCRYTLPGERLAAVPLMHDVETSAWGFGRGVRAYTHLRARTAWGNGAELWPQADDAVDLLAGYIELERTRYRLRAGRQWQVSGLGFYNFDGVNAGVAPVDGVWTEAYVGRSLLRGLNESRAGGALESIEEIAPRAGGVLAGVHARYRPSRRLAVGAAYQADFRTDGAGLYAELAAVDASYRAVPGSIDASLELDVATSALNEARVTLRSAPIGRFVVHGEARRYRPYFELWTIWGAFSPIGFDEVRGGLSWSDPAGTLVLRGDASYRSYGDAGIDNALDSFRGDGWSASADATWSPASEWRLDAAARVEGGFGAARRDGHAGVTRALGDVGSVSLQALAFQRLYEFRLSEGTVYGLAGELALRVHARAQLFAAGSAYRHIGNLSEGVDWNQRRATVRLQWTVGAEPALPPWRGGGGS
jgi:hypothetical protein